MTAVTRFNSSSQSIATESPNCEPVSLPVVNIWLNYVQKYMHLLKKNFSCLVFNQCCECLYCSLKLEFTLQVEFSHFSFYTIWYHKVHTFHLGITSDPGHVLHFLLRSRSNHCRQTVDSNTMKDACDSVLLYVSTHSIVSFILSGSLL